LLCNLKVLNPTINLTGFFQKLNQTCHQLLFLDYDGTLAPFKIRPEEAVPYPGVKELLKKIQECHKTQLVIVTGRTIKDLIPLLGLEDVPEIWGSHGLERLKVDGTYRVENISPEISNIFKKAREKIGHHQHGNDG